MTQPSLIQIYHADDNDRGVKFGQFVKALLDYFALEVPRHDGLADMDVGKGIRSLSQFLEYTPSAPDFRQPSRNFEDVLVKFQRDEPAHINIIDMRWVMKDGTVRDDAGRKLIEALINRGKEIEIFTNTAYAGELINSVLDLGMDLRIRHIRDNPAKGDLKEILPNAFRLTAQRILKNATYDERKTLIELVASSRSDEELLDYEMTIGREVFRVQNLFLCAFNPDTGRFEHLRSQIHELTKLNLMREASECFGIYGVKQATHPITQGYFLGDWSSKMVEQVDTLHRIIEHACRMSPTPNYLGTYREQVATFREKALEVLGNHAQAMSELNPLRNNQFRFGTSANGSTFMQFGSHILDASCKIGGHELEVYLPIHLIFQDEFRAIGAKSATVRCHAYMTNFKREEVTARFRQDKQPMLFKEYVIFGQAGNQEYPIDVPTERIPDELEVLRDKNFDCFGKIYLLLKRGNNWQLYDCGSKSALAVDRAVIESDLIWKEIKRSAGIVAFFVFEFEGWRQI